MVSSFAAGLSGLATFLSTINLLAHPGEVIANSTGFVRQPVGLTSCSWWSAVLLLARGCFVQLEQFLIRALSN